MIFKGFCVHTHFSSFYAQQGLEPDESRCRALSPEREPPSPSPKRVTVRSVGARTTDGQMGLWRTPIIPRCFAIIRSISVASSRPNEKRHRRLFSTCKSRSVPRLQPPQSRSAGDRIDPNCLPIIKLRRGRRLMGSSSRRLQVRSTSQGIPGALASRPPLRTLGGQDRMQLLETWWSLFVYAKI